MNAVLYAASRILAILAELDDEDAAAAIAVVVDGAFDNDDSAADDDDSAANVQPMALHRVGVRRNPAKNKKVDRHADIELVRSLIKLKNGPICTHDMAVALGIGHRGASRRMKALLDANLIMKASGGNSASYLCTDPEAEAGATRPKAELTR